MSTVIIHTNAGSIKMRLFHYKVLYPNHQLSHSVLISTPEPDFLLLSLIDPLFYIQSSYHLECPSSKHLPSLA
jgi:hypothetical protein